MRKLFFSLSLVAGLAFASHRAVAQSGGTPVKPSPATRYVLTNGAVVQRQGSTSTPLEGNIRLPNGTKVNVKSGIVELPTGKITAMHEGDYVKADGSIVFATPTSAAQARGEDPSTVDKQFSTYVLTGSEPSNATRKILLLNQKVSLMSQKIEILSKTQPASPETMQLDRQIQELDQQLSLENKTPDK